MEKADLNIPYFKNNYNGIVKNIYEKFIKSLLPIKDGFQANQTSDSKTSNKDGSSDDESSSNEESDSSKKSNTTKKSTESDMNKNENKTKKSKS